ncbi:hypothetical protein [Pseudomonas nitroreducens]|uniref:Uncharacterized protein n=1 Tax=Pseudomonas nitroreducens TaxID=46680 RepID=A0A6G6J0R9_PSENT|nr:hypothetical protein [Pseudomonas nitroreducens]QIE88834.1 hypothetical protein G5B91_22195 [Pseudomonas nitroreducens]
MNDIKTTTMIFKIANYTNKVKTKIGGRRQYHKSIRHSLRIPLTEPKKLEWIEENSHRNLIWTPKTGIAPLDSISKEQREKILESIASDAIQVKELAGQKSELVEERSKLKYRFNKAAKQETDMATIQAFQSILNVSGVADVDQLLGDLDQFDIKRKNQKMENARRFLECHNKIQALTVPKTRIDSTVLQEAFFKFPDKNQVEGISPEDRIKHILRFYKATLPDYPVLFVAFHGDENLDGKDHSDHPHIFVSGRNSKTGLYDIKRSQVAAVNEYLKKHKPKAKQLNYPMTWAESQLFGGYIQDMFYAFTNNYLLKETPNRARKHAKTEEHTRKLRQIQMDAMKPKSERAFNLYTLAQERQRDSAQRATLEQKKARQAEEQRIKAEQAAEDATERHRLVEQATAEERELAEAYRRKSEYYQGVLTKDRAEHAQEQAQHAKIKSELKLFRNNMSELIDGITNWIEETFSARRQDIQEKYLERARKAYERVRENDKSEDGRFTKKAEAQVDTQLAELELYDRDILDMPSANEVRRKIIKPR